MMRVVVIGVGGIGTALVPPLARFLCYRSRDIKALKDYTLVLVDGDTFEEKNRDRQAFGNLGNKAERVAELLTNEFPGLRIKFEPIFVTPLNVDTLIYEDDIVLVCVDNHKTRKMISDYCRELADVALISGGNELTDGNVQVYIRQDGGDVTPPLDSARHPEIANPNDKRPDEMSCEELAHSAPQLIFTNLTAAAFMLNCFYTLLMGKLKFQELFFDIISGNARSVRPLESEKLKLFRPPMVLPPSKKGDQ